MPTKRRLPVLHRRRLIKEPLTPHDWELVYWAYLGFQKHVETIVEAAKARAVASWYEAQYTESTEGE